MSRAITGLAHAALEPLTTLGPLTVEPLAASPRLGTALLSLLTVVLAAVAAGFAVRGPGALRGSDRLLPEVPVAAPGRSRGWVVPTVGLVGAGAGLAVGAAAGGARGAALVAAVLVAAGTVVRVGASHLAERRAHRAETEVAAACAVLASYVRVGQVAADALVLVARDCPVLAEAAAVQQIGGDVPAALRASAGRPGHGGLADLARAWQVSGTTGAPMAPALEEVAAGLASDESLRSVVSAELSAPRSTGKVMAVLPLVGIGLGYLLGGRPLGWLVAGPLGWACLLLGLLLAAAGVLWIEQLARAGSVGG